MYSMKLKRGDVDYLSHRGTAYLPDVDTIGVLAAIEGRSSWSFD
jgi:hypothetical protein